MERILDETLWMSSARVPDSFADVTAWSSGLIGEASRRAVVLDDG